MNKKDRLRIRRVFNRRQNNLVNVVGELALEKIYNDDENEVKDLDQEIHRIFWDIDELRRIEDEITKEE
jgi:hypothetical protein